MKRIEMSKQKTLLIAAATTAAVVLGLGCKNDKNEEAQNALFKSDGEERVSTFVDVQASNGARNDGMLYAHHFTAGRLNSLGRSKVLLILDDSASENGAEPGVVYLVNAGEGDLLAQRKASVELYLKTAEGPNKLALHPAAPNIIRFAKTESGSLDGSDPSGQSSGATPLPMTGMSTASSPK